MTDAAVEQCSLLTLVRILQLASAASPVGSYAQSEGLEYAVAAGDVRDQDTASEWIGGLLIHGVCALDLPLLMHMHGAWEAGDAEQALRLSAWLLACREARELRLADRQQGQALVRVLADLGAGAANRLRGERRVSYACAFALAGRHFGIPPLQAGLAYAYAWLENMVLAAIKLVPLGQASGQRMLLELGTALEKPCRTAARVELASIAAGAPGQALASALHEDQATRLFRS